MRKENKAFFEEMRFDDVLFAQNTLKECEGKLNRNKIGVVVSLLVPVFDVIVSLILEKMNNGDAAFTWWFIAAIVAYVIGGGLMSSLKMVWKTTVFSWFIIPIFPIDACVAIVAFCTAGAVALFLPIVFVLMTRYQLSKDKKAAEAYLRCCKPIENVEIA